MDEVWFEALPALCRNRKFLFEEIHVILCPQPRPVAVKVGAGYKKLPDDLWPVAEFLVRTLQGARALEGEPCQIDAFLTQLLRKAIVEAGVLETDPCLDGGGVLLSLLTARAKSAPTVAKQSKRKEETNATLAKIDQTTKTETPQPTGNEHILALELSHPSLVAGEAMTIIGKNKPTVQDVEQNAPTEIHATATDQQQNHEPSEQEVPTEIEAPETNERHKNPPAELEVPLESKDEEPKCDNAECETGTDTEAEPNEQMTETRKFARAQQETAKQRRRKKRRKRLRQEALK